jgi:pyruvate dehydrogenase E1 component
MNENYEQPDLLPHAHEAVVKGMYEFARREPAGAKSCIHLLGSGAIMREVIAAADLLFNDWQISSIVWSVTSFSEIAREAREVSRHNRLHPSQPARKSHLSTCLSEPFPIVAATDYVVAYPHLIGPYVEQPFVALGTDGFGRSDTREALRRFFEVDRYHIAVTALHTLAEQSLSPESVVEFAIERYKIDSLLAPPWTR